MTLELLLEMRNSVDLLIIWGNVWQSNCSETNKLDASEILTKHVTPQVIESTMVHGKEDFDVLIGFCLGNAIPIPGSERVVWIVMERCHYAEILEGLLRSKPKVRITQEQFDYLAAEEGICYWVFDGNSS
jgi:hypothetical protein